MWAHLDNLLDIKEQISDLIPANWAYDPDDHVSLEETFGIVPVDIELDPLDWWQRHGDPTIDQSVRPVLITYRAVPDEPTPQQLEARERKARLMRARERGALVMGAIEALTVQTTAQLVRNETLPADQITALAPLYPDYEVGKAYPVGAVFQFHGGLVEVVQAHTSQADWRPDETPAIYKMHRPEGVPLPWVRPTGSHDAYKMGERVQKGGREWASMINANTTEPGTDPRWWVPVEELEPDEGVRAWAPDEAVAVDELREFDGTVYRVVQAHTTQAGWEPPNVPALWAAEVI